VNILDTSSQSVSSHISQSAASAETGMVNLVDTVTNTRAENIPGLVNQMYLKNVVKKLADSEQEIRLVRNINLGKEKW